MQTSNYQINLLSQNQAMKEYTINHGFNKVDWLLNRSAIDLVSELPLHSKDGDIYTLQDGRIGLYIEGAWQYLKPHSGAIMYVKNKGKFYMQEDELWIRLG